MSDDWVLYVADETGRRQAQIDTFEFAEIIGRANDVGTWMVTLDTATEAGAAFLADTGSRLQATFSGRTWRSGPMTHRERVVDLDRDVLVVSGVDDTVWISRRLGHPDPFRPEPPYNEAIEWTASGDIVGVLGLAVDYNLGPSAVAARQVPGLTITPTDPDGPTVEIRLRWQNLLTAMQDLARPTDCLFEIVDLKFRAWIATESGAVFSQGLETLGQWTLTDQVPSANKVVVGGSGTGTARVIREVQDIASQTAWGLVEQFVDKRDTADTALLDAAGAEALAGGVPPTTVVFSALETPGQRFGVDWRLGDRATVIVDNLVVNDIIREVHVTLDDVGATIVPSIGAPGGDLRLFRSVSSLERRMRNLERV